MDSVPRLMYIHLQHRTANGSVVFLSICSTLTGLVVFLDQVSGMGFLLKRTILY